MSQKLSSSASNTLEENWQHWSHPVRYVNPNPSDFPLPDIYDNTEGIGGYHDLYIPSTARTLLDVGGGKFDGPCRWMEANHPQIKMHVIDPFSRSKQHNCQVQKMITEIGGADIVTSISVLNVIDNVTCRLRHIFVVYDALRMGGLAYFKVWAGYWPMRGTGVAEVDEDRQVFQANAWAHEFKEEVEYIFGKGNVYVDNNKNLLIAKRSVARL